MDINDIGLVAPESGDSEDGRELRSAARDAFDPVDNAVRNLIEAGCKLLSAEGAYVRFRDEADSDELAEVNQFFDLLAKQHVEHVRTCTTLWMKLEESARRQSRASSSDPGGGPGPGPSKFPRKR